MKKEVSRLFFAYSFLKRPIDKRRYAMYNMCIFFGEGSFEMKTNQEKLQKIVYSAMFCALVFAATWISVPAPSVGNVNLGDAAVLLSAWMLGGAWAAVAAGLGAALTDLVSGYAIYAPATFLIKALMVAAVLGFCRLSVRASRSTRLFRILSAVLAELVMILGYFLYESLVLGYGWAALASIPFNAVQGALGIALAVATYELLDRAGIRLGRKN